MTDAPWWLPLQELSDPAIRPPRLSSRPLQSHRTLESVLGDVGELFRAYSARFWRFSTGRKAKSVSFWTNEPANTQKATPYELDVDRERIRSDTNRLLILAVSERKPLWVEDNKPRPSEPHVDSSPAGRVGFRLFIPLNGELKDTAVIELILQRHGQRIAKEDRERYLQAAYRLSQTWTDWETPDIDRKPSMLESSGEAQVSQPPIQPLVGLNALREIFDQQQTQTIRMLEAELVKLEGSKLSSLRENQAFASGLHQILEAHALRVRCPHCGEAAILRCQAASNVPSGVFVFDHYLKQGRTFHGGRTTLPRLYLVTKPPRRSIQVQINVP